MAEQVIHSEKFYIFSYPPFTRINNETPHFVSELIEQGFPKEGIIDFNALGKSILGAVPSFNPINDTLGEFNLASFSSNGQMNTIAEEIIRARCSQALPTILIGNFPSYSKVEKYIDIAKTFGYSSSMLYMDVDKEDIMENYMASSHIYPRNYLETFVETYNLSKTQQTGTVFNNTTKLKLLPSVLQHTDVEVLGDVHGMLPHLKEHLAKKGWKFNSTKNCFSHEDKNKALLFLGDIVDRHPDSVEMLKVVKATCQSGQGYLLLGNHESKLLQSYRNFLDTGIVRGRSLSSSQTFTSFLKLPHTERQDLYHFLLSRPTSYTLLLNEDLTLSSDVNTAFLKFGFVHADTTCFNPFNNSVSTSMYGATKDFAPLKDMSDEIYQKGFNNGINDYVLFRGHCVNQGKHTHVYSLDFDQAFDGHIASLNMKDYLKDLSENNFIFTHDMFVNNTLLTETNYNFDKEFSNSLYGGVLKLLEKKLIVDGVYNIHSNPSKQAHHEGFQIFKYAKSVHFDRLWDSEPLLEKTRGIVFDIGGQIIVHPFNKLYNYEEYDAGKHLTPDHKVRAVEKLNGFLGCITKHPYRNDLLYSTTGNLDNDFTNYIKSFVTPELKQNMLNFFAANGNHTLMFEVLHPEDPHIIQYTKEQQGLWLIGARGLLETDKVKTENELDIIGKTLSLRRPEHFTCSFGELLSKLPSCEHEGFMIWEIKENGEEVPIMKIKSDYYLVTKFLSRITPKKIESLYKDHKAFRQTIDEEYYSLTEHIVHTYPKEQFLKMTEIERVKLIQDFIHNERESRSSNAIKL